MATDKEKAVELAIEQIERQYGKGSIMKLGEAPARVAGDAIPTGALALDLALGIGGIPRGRVTEIFGSEASGKTTLAQHIIAETQKAGVLLHILMPSTPSIQPMLLTAVSIYAIYLSRNLTPASKPWKLPKLW